MPRRSSLTPKGREILRGGKRRKGKGLTGPRPFFRPPSDDIQPIVVNGHKLNRPETRLYYLLAERNEDWQPQVTIFAWGRVGKPDFLSYQRHMVIEVDGPFHDTEGGAMKDFIRNEVRRQAGFDVLRIKEADIESPRIRGILKQALG